VALVYIINDLISLNMVRQWRAKTISTTKANGIARMIFYVFECIIFPVYAISVYLSMDTIMPPGFLPKNFTEALLFVAFLSLVLGFISSIMHIIFTWPFYRMIKKQYAELLDTIGETDPATLHNTSY
jgi:hypothetical protein